MLAFLQRVDDAILDGELQPDQYAALVVPELDNLRAADHGRRAKKGSRKIAIALAAHGNPLIDYAADCADWLLPHRQQVEAGVVEEAVAARYWRALSAVNMFGRVPLAEGVDAAERARSMYQSLGKPRRVFGSLIRLVLNRRLQGNQATLAHAALAEARSLIQPDLLGQFHIRLLCREREFVREAGRLSDALVINREEVRLRTATWDRLLEVFARTNLVDLLWQVGPIEEAAREARQLGEELRVRPSAATHMNWMFGSLIGILCEMDLVAEALAVAREALPIMRRSRDYYFADWVYLFWRLRPARHSRTAAWRFRCVIQEIRPAAAPQRAAANCPRARSAREGTACRRVGETSRRRRSLETGEAAGAVV